MWYRSAKTLPLRPAIAFSRFAIDIPWRVYTLEHVMGVLLTMVLVAAIGVLSSLDVLRHKPLATLRAE